MPTRKLQNSDEFLGQKFYVGIDVHKKSWAVTVRSLNFVVGHFTQPPSPEALQNKPFTKEEIVQGYFRLPLIVNLGANLTGIFCGPFAQRSYRNDKPVVGRRI